MSDIVPEKCTCSRAGTCPFCKSLAWGFDAGLFSATKPEQKRAPNPRDAGGFRSVGKRNSANAVAKCKHTRIRKERERMNAAKARRALEDGARARDVKAILVAIEAVAPLPADTRARLHAFLMANTQVGITIAATPTEDDYREKVVRPDYLTRGTRVRDDEGAD